MLVLSDGRRSAEAIAGIVGTDVEPVSVADVHQCLAAFQKEGLIEGSRSEPLASSSKPGPRTLAGLQAAYSEWHSDPAKTGVILRGAPFPGPRKAEVGAESALNAADTGRLGVGSTLLVGTSKRAARSLLDAKAAPVASVESDSLDVVELLAAVDDDLSIISDPSSPPPSVAATRSLPPAFAPTVVGRPPEAPGEAPQLLAPLRTADTDLLSVGTASIDPDEQAEEADENVEASERLSPGKSRS